MHQHILTDRTEPKWWWLLLLCVCVGGRGGNKPRCGRIGPIEPEILSKE